MKKTLIATALLACAVSAFSQGTIQFGNLFGTGGAGSFWAPIYGPDPANPTLSLSGQSALGRPVGTTVYGGALLNGTSFTMALYGGTSAGNLQLVGTAAFRSAAGNVLPAGTILTTVIPVQGVLPGTRGTFEVRVWDNKGGQVTTWAEALARTDVARGTSGIFSPTGFLGGTDEAGNLFLPPTLSGWTSFNIAIVPEPSVIALGALGLGALLLRRRKN